MTANFWGIILGRAGLAIALALLVVLTGCGGGGGSGEDINIDFDVSAYDSVSEGEVRDVTRDRLTSVVFLADWLTLVQAFESHGAVMSGLGDVDPESVNVGWVRRVHDASEKAQIFHGEGLRLAIPADAPGNYESIFAAYVAGVEAYGFASARLLEAALILGPSGRGFDEMEALEQLSFRSSLKQFGIYRDDALALMVKVDEMLMAAIEDARVDVEGMQ